MVTSVRHFLLKEWSERNCLGRFVILIGCFVRSRVPDVLSGTSNLDSIELSIELSTGQTHGNHRGINAVDLTVRFIVS